MAEVVPTKPVEPSPDVMPDNRLKTVMYAVTIASLIIQSIKVSNLVIPGSNADKWMVAATFFVTSLLAMITGPSHAAERTVGENES